VSLPITMTLHQHRCYPRWKEIQTLISLFFVIPQSS
jgi:hypothetical protein